MQVAVHLVERAFWVETYAFEPAIVTVFDDFGHAEERAVLFDANGKREVADRAARCDHFVGERVSNLRFIGEVPENLQIGDARDIGTIAETVIVWEIEVETGLRKVGGYLAVLGDKDVIIKFTLINQHSMNGRGLEGIARLNKKMKDRQAGFGGGGNHRSFGSRIIPVLPQERPSRLVSQGILDSYVVANDLPGKRDRRRNGCYVSLIAATGGGILFHFDRFSRRETDAIVKVYMGELVVGCANACGDGDGFVRTAGLNGSSFHRNDVRRKRDGLRILGFRRWDREVGVG